MLCSLRLTEPAAGSADVTIVPAAERDTTAAPEQLPFLADPAPR